ncbi:MAG: HIT family protein [Acidobacteria bacterium]|nr:HIT family protein [Acidobacteriota bacterium]
MHVSCTFCRDSTIDAVWSDARCSVLLHEDSAVRGHAMVVWRTHVENFSDLSEEDALHFARVHRAAEKALLEVTGAERAVLLKLGILTPHLHLHIYPVSSSLDRAAVMAILDAKTREEREADFAEKIRTRIPVSF